MGIEREQASEVEKVSVVGSLMSQIPQILYLAAVHLKDEDLAS